MVFLLGAFLFPYNLFAQKKTHKQDRKHKNTHLYERKREIEGIASWYSNKFENRRTANGEIFSQKKMTCATNHFKIGTWLRVTNILKKKSVVVRVNDRMGASTKRVIDLTKAAAIKLGLIKQGLAKVRIENLGTERPSHLE